MSIIVVGDYSSNTLHSPAMVFNLHTITMPTPEEIAAQQAEEADVLNALGDVLGKPAESTDPTPPANLPTNPTTTDGEEVEKLKEQNQKLEQENKDKEIIASKAISKKNKWKDKYLQAAEKLKQLQGGELDDSFDSERDRDLEIVATQSEVTMAKSQYEEAQNEEKEAFYAENPFARENLTKVEELAEKHSLDTESAYKLFLANNHPEKLYDVHKVRQNDGGLGMIKNGSTRSAGSTVEDMSVEQLEQSLIQSHKEGNLVL